MPADASALNRTLRQLYAPDGGAGLGRVGHVMYSDQPPLVDGLSDEESFDAVFTQGKGVMVLPCFSSSAIACIFNTAHVSLLFAWDDMWSGARGVGASVKQYLPLLQGYGEDQGFWLVHSVPSFPVAPWRSAYTGTYSCQHLPTP